MILECSDLERALRTPELMPDMRAHAEQCAACSEQLYLWSEISRLAPGLHEEWESPFLWSRIEANLAAEPARHRAVSRAPWWRWALAAAGVILLAAAMLQPWQHAKIARPGVSHRECIAGSPTGREGVRPFDREALGGGGAKPRSLVLADGRRIPRKTDAAGFGNCGVEGHGREQPVQHLLADRAGFALPAETTDTPGMVTECES